MTEVAAAVAAVASAAAACLLPPLSPLQLLCYYHNYIYLGFFFRKKSLRSGKEVEHARPQIFKEEAKITSANCETSMFFSSSLSSALQIRRTSSTNIFLPGYCEGGRDAAFADAFCTPAGGERGRRRRRRRRRTSRNGKKIFQTLKETRIEFLFIC